MKRSRQDFFSRGKNFNSNGTAGLDTRKDKAKKAPVKEFHPKGNKDKAVEKVKEIPPAMTNGKSQIKAFGKKGSPAVNGIHKVAEKPPQKADVKGKPVEKKNSERAGQKSPKITQNNSVVSSKKATPDTGQKRKIQEGPTPSKKVKKEKPVPSESDSDAEDYMARFFQDLPESDDDGGDDGQGASFAALLGLNNLGDDSTDESDSSSSESDDSDEDGNGMSLEELINYYGSNKDLRKEKVAPEKKKNDKKQDKTERKEVPKRTENGNKRSGGAQNGWVEEDNDLELVYKDSDSEEVECRALVPVVKDDTLHETSSDDGDYSPEELGDEEEDFSDEDEMLSFEIGEDSSGEEEETEDSLNSHYSSEDSHDSDSRYDDHEFGSDYDSDAEEEDYYSDEEDWNDSYDSEDDDDYEPMDDEYLFIGRGEARIYEIDDNNISFNSDIESAQIIELPSDDGRRPSTSATSAYEESQTEEESEGVVPKLVPIYDGRGRMIDSQAKLEKALAFAEKKSQSSSKQPETATPIVPKTTQSDAQPDPEGAEDDLEDSVFARDLTMNVDEDAEPVAPALDERQRASYRFYDSIDMRMSLVVLKDVLFVSGYLTVQPLIGALEVMGYRLKRGECRNVFAARGYHSLDLRPCADGPGYSKEIMAGVLTRLDMHFQDVDLRELEERFDPSDSVLVLLQADCNNRRMAVVERYLPEEVLFPRVEFLKKSPFFTTEYLLNAEFFVEQVEKGTTLFTADPEWNRIELRKNSRVVVMGGKGAGKSTLCQYLINRNVGQFGKILLIDLDIGQPIQHIPETISVTVISKPLLGVASFDPIAPVKSWLFGSLDVVSSPIFYLQNVRQLIQFCQAHSADLGNIPWVVNTMGYVTGFGEELMAAVLRMLSPTDVIQLYAPLKSLAIPNFQNVLSSDFVNKFTFNILRNEVQQFGPRKASFRHHHLAVSYPRKGFTLNAPKRRNVALLTHLARILNDSSSEWFNEVKPFRAPLADLQVLITRDEDHCLAQDQLPAVLNATLVYLCRKGTSIGTYECLGIGIVRGVDKAGNVYLLQSLAGEDLAEVTVLAICSSSLPSAAFLRQSTRIQGAIPYVYSVD